MELLLAGLQAVFALAQGAVGVDQRGGPLPDHRLQPVATPAQLVGHRVERGAQRSDLVPAADVDARRQVTAGEPPGGGGQPCQRRRDPPRHRAARDERDHPDRDRDRQVAAHRARDRRGDRGLRRQVEHGPWHRAQPAADPVDRIVARGRAPEQPGIERRGARAGERLRERPDGGEQRAGRGPEPPLGDQLLDELGGERAGGVERENRGAPCAQSGCHRDRARPRGCRCRRGHPRAARGPTAPRRSPGAPRHRAPRDEPLAPARGRRSSVPLRPRGPARTRPRSPRCRPARRARMAPRSSGRPAPARRPRSRAGPRG